MNNIETDKQDIFKIIEKSLPYEWLGLRRELILNKSAPNDDGSPAWTLEDPIQGVYFQFGEFEAALIICLITEESIKAAVQKLIEKTTFKPSPTDIIKLLTLLQKEKLAMLSSNYKIEEIKKSADTNFFMKILTGYLFIQIPLLKPDRFITKLLPFVKVLWSKPLIFLYSVFSTIGIIFVLQQWELYWHTANHLFTPSGAIAFFLAGSLVKTLHEFGHAFAAKRYNLFVRRIGLAFMIFMPILYCDVSDTWRLSDKKGRIFIGAAGMLTELVIAGLSLFFWSILTDGIMRSIMFYLSSASIVSSIFTNMNPLMRYDAYYILMDYLAISNLRSRSKALFRYAIHRIIADWKAPIPEIHPKHNLLVLFGFVSLIYRIFIFTAITFAIYHYVFKALGVILVIAQLLLMFLIPLFMEIRFLSKNRQYLGERKKIMRSISIAALIILIIVLPLQKTYRLPGLFLAEKVVKIKSPVSGKIIEELPLIGKQVKEGETLLTIENRGIELKLKQLTYDMQKIDESLYTVGTYGAEGGYRKWLLAEKDRIAAASKTVKEELARSTIKSSFQGYVADLNEAFGKNSYISKNAYLLTIADQQSKWAKYEISAYADAKMYRELKSEKKIKARILFKNIETGTINATLKQMSDFPVETFANNSLFDFAGGSIISNRLPNGEVRTKTPYYQMLFDIPANQDVSSLKHGCPCKVLISIKSSYAADFFLWVWKGLAVEGFI